MDLTLNTSDELIKKNFTAKRLSFTTNIDKAISTSDIIFICVGTPTRKGSIQVDLSFVYKCTKEILKYSKRKKIIVTKSTVPVGTGDEIEKILKRWQVFKSWTSLRRLMFSKRY